MNFLQAISKKVAFLTPSERTEPSQIFLLSEITNQSLPAGILALSKLSRAEKSPINSQGVVIPNNLIQDFWTYQNLDKKIKNITTTINLRHPRSISSGAASIQRLIARQTIPVSWKTEWKKLLRTLPKNSRHTLTFSLYFESDTIGQSDWLPELTGPATEASLLKLLHQSLAALYGERFIREREQRGFAHAHLPVTLLITWTEANKTKNEIDLKFSSNYLANVATVAVATKDQKQIFSVLKSALTNHKSLILNNWNQTLLPEAVLQTVLAPILELEKNSKQTVKITGYINLVKKTLDINYLGLQTPQTTETVVEFVLKNPGQTLGTGKWFGQGIAVGPLTVLRENTKQTMESGLIVVAKNFKAVSPEILANAGGLIIEDGSPSAEIIWRSLNIKIPVILGVKQAVRRLRSGTTVTLAAVDSVGTVFAGALPYEVKPITAQTKKIKTELRSPNVIISVDDLVCELGNRHPLDYFKNKNNNYTELLGQKLAEQVARKSGRVMVEFSSSLPSVFAVWSGGVKAEKNLKLRQSARGAERYLHPRYAAVLAAECAALKSVRDKFGLLFDLKLPYCRSSSELEDLLAALKKHGITREQNWRFILATDMPGHALLTESLARQLDELIFDVDALVKSATGERATTITNVRQKTVEQALSSIAKTAAKEHTRIALTGNLLVREPRLVLSAIKSGVKTLVVGDEQKQTVRNSVYEAERTVGNRFGTNHQVLGAVAGFACLSILFVTVGAGCGQQAKVEAPQMTPAQIRAEIMTALQEERAKTANEKIVETVTGFADFKVSHTRDYEATYSPNKFVLNNQVNNTSVTFTALTKFGITSSTDFVTDSGLSGKLFVFDDVANNPTPLVIYEIQLNKNNILKIETTTTSLAIMEIAKSVQSI